MNMIEKVARAIHAKSGWPYPYDEDTCPADGEHLRKMQEFAKAAIEAMRDPTDKMVDAGITKEVGWEYGERGDPDAPPYVSSHASYLAMIDAALEETAQ